jgi:hypothetical protein
MSRLTIEMHRDHQTMQTLLVMKDEGLGRVVIDDIPPMFTQFANPVDLMADLKYRFKAMYFYCASRTPTKAVAMTWEQAMNTSDYLKESV